MEETVHDTIQDTIQDTIRDIERVCQEKLLVFQKLLSVFRKERKAIIKADVSALWIFSKEKQVFASEIRSMRTSIFEKARDAGFIEDNEQDYSLVKVIASLKPKEKGTLVNLNMALNEMKRKISALSHENKVYLEESLKTIEDLVRIITKNCVREERYGRETYMRPSSYSRMAVMVEGV